MEKKRKKSRIGTVIVLIILILIVLLFAMLPRFAHNAAAEDSRAIVAGIVEQNALVHTITSSAMLETDEPAEVKIHPGIRVTELCVSLGDTVEVGDVLAKVDKVSVMNAITDIQSTMDSLTWQLRSLGIRPVNVTLDSDGILYADGNKVQNENIVKYAQYLTLSDEHRFCEMRLQELFALYRSGVVTAEHAGLIDALDKTIAEPLAFRAGVTMDADSSSFLAEEDTTPLSSPSDAEAEKAGRWGGTLLDESIEPELFGEASRTLCEIIPMETARFEVSVSEQDITGIVPDMTVEVLLTALPGESREGRVSEISKFGSGSTNGSRFTVTIELPFTEGMLPGMTATAVFTLETRKASLSVPVAALSDINGRTVVYTGHDPETGELTDPVEVTLGFSDGEYAEIQSDSLRRGQVIYYEVFE